MVVYVKNRQVHPFHLVDPSPHPFFLAVSFAPLGLAIGSQFDDEIFLLRDELCFTIGMIFVAMFSWWSNVLKESRKGHHTKEVQKGLRIGMILFIISEFMFFFSLFWAFFHSSINPNIFIGSWPPLGVNAINPWGLPFLNTALLLASGVSVTWAHHAIRAGNYKDTFEGLLFTILLGLKFIFVQIKEYLKCPFTIADSVFGSCFFLLTGFHGFHVFVGVLFIIVCFLRHLKCQFSRKHHVGFECALWYWHFVDVVWLFLFVSVYIWSW